MDGENMNEKHTPGPWKVDQTWALIVGPKMEEIAAVHSSMPSGGNRVSWRQTAEANARLIAAAPDLLQALESLLVELGKKGGNTPASEFRGMWETARAAIAKAEGK